MWKLLIVTVLFVGRVDGSLNRVCYYTNWSQYRPSGGRFTPDQVDPKLCTHLIYAFATLSTNHLKAFEWNDEDTPWMKGMYSKFNELKIINPGLKTLLAVGGWNMGSPPFTALVSTYNNRQKFIQDTIKFLRQRQFDGIDLDWEYPANRGSPKEDRGHFTELVSEMRKAFDQEAVTSGQPKLLLTAAVAAGKSKIDTGYDIPAVSRDLDMINLMTYDLHGSWETYTGHNSPLFSRAGETGDDLYLNMNWAAKYWVQKGAPKSKLNIGMALYGRTFTLSDANKDTVGAPISRAGQAGQYTRENGFVSYYEICNEINNGATRHEIKEQMVPYVVLRDQWVGYDDPQSLKIKVDYVKQNGFGGVMVWALDLDDFSGAFCGQGNYPLLQAINDEILRPGNGVPIIPINTQPPITIPPHPVVTTLPRTTPPNHHTLSLSAMFSCFGRSNGFYANPTSCTQYYICVAGNAFSVDCASGLEFNKQTLYCDWPANAKCSINVVHSSPKPTAVTYKTTKSTVLNAQIFCATKQQGVYKDPTNCHTYYHCANSVNSRITCPANLVFNDQIKACDHKYHVPGC